MQIALAFMALCLPGFAWWLWLGDHEQDGGEALARIFAVSSSFITLVALAFYTVRLSFTPLVIGLLLSLCIGLVLAGLIHSWKSAFNKTWLVALLVLALFVVWRLWQARELVFPNWVDSQHHVLIIRKIIENGGLPSTLEPYLPGPFYYHFAFHAVTAFFSVLSGLAPEQAVLVLGQVMNACVGVSVYALAKSISRDWRVGLLAAFFVTFVTKMPGYYLSWGRYTLLMGVMILPMAMAEAERLRMGTVKWWQGVGMFLLTVGTLLSHYLAAFLFGLYLVIMGVAWVIESVRARKIEWKPILTLAVPALLALVVSMRWYIRVISYSSSAIDQGISIPTGKLALANNQIDYLKYIMGPEPAYALALLAVLGMALALSKPKWRCFAIWSFMIGLLTVPLGIVIFGFRSDHFSLVLFVLFGTLAGWVLVEIVDFLQMKIGQKKPIIAAGILLVLVLLGFGMYDNSDAINDETVLVEKADVIALEWIKNHTKNDARFFVNTTGWGYGVYRGVDGGGWILPTTGRWSLAPTIFYTFAANELTAETWQDWSKRASIVADCQTDFWELVEEADLSYVYIRKGTTGLQAENLVACEGVRKLYDNDGTSIWLIDGYNP